VRTCTGLLCERTADVWMRGKAWCRPCWIKRFGFATSPARHGEAVAPEAAPDREAGVMDALSSAPAPGPFFDDELVALLERQGWDEIDLELALISHLEEDA
jgi:hypothetical protein